MTISPISRSTASQKQASVSRTVIAGQGTIAWL